MWRYTEGWRASEVMFGVAFMGLALLKLALDCHAIAMLARFSRAAPTGYRRDAKLSQRVRQGIAQPTALSGRARSAPLPGSDVGSCADPGPSLQLHEVQASAPSAPLPAPQSSSAPRGVTVINV